jgi:hypothetical protein
MNNPTEKSQPETVPSAPIREERQNATFHVAHSISVDDYIAIEPKP